MNAFIAVIRLAWRTNHTIDYYQLKIDNITMLCPQSNKKEKKIKMSTVWYKIE